jgi:hypothetical protein
MNAAGAVIDGKSLRLENGRNLGFWSTVGDRASWPLRIHTAGTFRIELEYALGVSDVGSSLTLAVGERRLTVTPAATEGWGDYRVRTIGLITLPAGEHELSLRADKLVGGALNLSRLTLVPESAPDAAPVMGARDGGPMVAPAVCR